MNLSNSPKILFGLAGVVALLGGGLNYMQYSALTEQQAALDAEQQKLDKAAGVRVELEESTQRLQDLRVKLAHLEKGVPEFAYVPTMLRELESFGKANNVQLTGVRPMIKPVAPTKPDEKVVRKAYTELTIEVKGRGRYGDVMRFVQGLNRFPKIVAARTVSLTPRRDAEDASNVTKLDVAIELGVFVFAEQSGAAASPRTVNRSGGVQNNG